MGNSQSLRDAVRGRLPVPRAAAGGAPRLDLAKSVVLCYSPPLEAARLSRNARQIWPDTARDRCLGRPKGGVADRFRRYGSKRPPMMRMTDGPVCGGPWLRIFAVGIALSIAGCDGAALVVWPVWPFSDHERVEYETPAQRISRIEAEAERVIGQDQAAQEAFVRTVAEKLRNETDPLVRERIIRTLAELDAPAAVALLRAGLGDTDPDVRVACCAGLARHQDAESLAALTDTLRRDEDIDVRLAATRALASYRDPAAVRAMAIALEDRDPALQFRAVQSLRQMTGLDYGNDVGRWLEFAQKGQLPAKRPLSIAERLRRLSPF